MTRGAVWAVLPAAGIGARMGGETPKQYLEVGGRSVLEHAVACLCRGGRIAGVVLSIRYDDARGRALAGVLEARHGVPMVLADGGARRQDSVASGLDAVPDEASAVLVHDAARPCLHADDLSRILAYLDAPAPDGRDSLRDGALLATPLAETLKRAASVDGGGIARVAETVDRRGLWRAQTPQLFRRPRLREALARASADAVEVTDEAQAVERLGGAPRLVEGRADNIKVTLRSDLETVARMLSPNSSWSRSQEC